jgi:hypothetical protein
MLPVASRVLAAKSGDKMKGFQILKWVSDMYLISSLTIRTKAESSSAFWQIVGWFGDVKFDELNGLKINQLDNILTLNSEAHHLFDRLDLWFEEVPVSIFFSILYLATLTSATRTRPAVTRLYWPNHISRLAATRRMKFSL